MCRSCSFQNPCTSSSGTDQSKDPPPQVVAPLPCSVTGVQPREGGRSRTSSRCHDHDGSVHRVRKGRGPVVGLTGPHREPVDGRHPLDAEMLAEQRCCARTLSYKVTTSGKLRVSAASEDRPWKNMSGMTMTFVARLVEGSVALPGQASVDDGAAALNPQVTQLKGALRDWPGHRRQSFHRIPTELVITDSSPLTRPRL